MYFTTFFAGDLVWSFRVSMRNGLGALSTFSTSMCEKEERMDKWWLRRSEIGPRTAFRGECHVGEPRTRPSAYRDRLRLQLDIIQRGLTMSLVPKGSDPSMTSGRRFFIFESAV